MKKIIPIVSIIIAVAALVISIVAVSIASSDHAFVSELRDAFTEETSAPEENTYSSEYSYDIIASMPESLESYGSDSYEKPTAMTIPQSVIG